MVFRVEKISPVKSDVHVVVSVPGPQPDPASCGAKNSFTGGPHP